MENIIKVWQNNHNITLYFMPHQTYVLKILRQFSLSIECILKPKPKYSKNI